MKKISKWVKQAMSLQEAYKLFNLDEKSFDLNELKRIYHRYVLMYHPDHGGDAKKMTLITQAKDLIENHILSFYMGEHQPSLNKEEMLKEMTTRVDDVKQVVNKIKHIWVKYLNKYIAGQCTIHVDEIIEPIYFTITVALKFETVSFIVKLKSFNLIGKIYLNYNCKMILDKEYFIVKENNRRITISDLDQPEYFFPNAILHKFFPIIQNNNFTISGRQKVISLLKELGAIPINELAYQIEIGNGNYIIVRCDTGKLFKTPTWTLYGIYDKNHKQIQEKTVPYIETFDPIFSHNNIPKLINDIKKLKH